MDKKSQSRKAERLRDLHHDPRLLVLPNIWDPMGARLLEPLGFPAVATASASVSYSLGYNDGELITFDAMLAVIRGIATSVEVPVTADIERGYADSLEGVADNIAAVLDAGAVGINIEDSFEERGELRTIVDQCDRIRAVRAAAGQAGIPLVINARTDVWLSKTKESPESRQEEIIERTRAYMDAGADCVYPVTLGDPEILRSIFAATQAPLNVYVSAGAASMKDLEDAGISRVSVGPGLVKAVLATMKSVALGLKNYDSYEHFTETAMQTPEILEFVRKDKMS